MYTRECVVVDGCICMVRMYIRLYMRARARVCICVHASSSPQTARILNRVSRRGPVRSHRISSREKSSEIEIVFV